MPSQIDQPRSGPLKSGEVALVFAYYRPVKYVAGQWTKSMFQIPYWENPTSPTTLIPSHTHTPTKSTREAVRGTIRSPNALQGCWTRATAHRSSPFSTEGKPTRPTRRDNSSVTVGSVKMRKCNWTSFRSQGRARNKSRVPRTAKGPPPLQR